MVRFYHSAFVRATARYQTGAGFLTQSEPWFTALRKKVSRPEYYQRQ
jgi:hypothetical protein